jgi:hypothetical protein
MTAVFGYTIANHVICTVSGYPLDYSVSVKGRDRTYDSVLGALQATAERLARTEAGEDPIGLRIPINKDDVVFLLDEVFRGKSVITGLPSRITLIPWEVPAGGFGADKEWLKEGQKYVRIDIKNLVCMTKDEATRHEREVLKGKKKLEEVYDKSILLRVEQRRREIEEFEKYR